MASGRPVESQLSEQLDDYLAAFNRGDFSTAASHYHEPSVRISAAGISVLPARHDLANSLSAMVERLREDGFDHSEWIGLKKVIVLDSGLAFASCGCKRLRKDGSSCEEFTATYTLRMTDEEWRVVAIQQHPLAR